MIQNYDTGLPITNNRNYWLRAFLCLFLIYFLCETVQITNCVKIKKRKEITINIYNNYSKLKKIIEIIVLFVFSNGFISLVFIKMILKIIAEMLKKSESNKD